MYDYIIVGAGSAGCVLANRLTEDPHVSVLLLEAGGQDDRPEIHMPIAFTKLFQTACDWAYETQAQPQLHNRCLSWPRGKVLGGCSSINIMVYTRGSACDYDRWSASGNAGWSSVDVLPYFKKAERQQRGASLYHGGTGPLHVADQLSPNVLSRAFVKAGVEIGLARTDDFNGDTLEGVGLVQVTQKRGMRQSTADAYLRPALKRANLTLQTETHVQRVLFEEGRARGVAYTQGGKEEQALAHREVILSAGSINSPQLLLLSGVGPAEHLQALDLPVVAHLPGVGQNLQDHLLVPVCYTCRKPVSLAGAQRFRHLLNYLLFKRGPLTSNVGEAAAFYKTSEDLPAPDLEMAFTPLSFLDPAHHGYTFGPIGLAPQSRGSLALRSRDPQEAPLIEPGYLNQESDLQTLISGVKLARRLAQTSAFAPYRGEEFAPGAQVQSDQEIAAFIREYATTVYHPVGTCRMGNDPLAVVDRQLRVRAVEGLRVVDASIMPTLIHGHPNAPIIMIAEKAADIIKNDSLPSVTLQAAQRGVSLNTGLLS